MESKHQEDSGWMTQIACCLPQQTSNGPMYSDGIAKQTFPICEQPRREDRPQYCPAQENEQVANPVRAREWLATARSSFSSTQRPWTSHSARKLTIGAPTDFRRLDVVPKRRQSFQPLELSIYMQGGNLSPLPDFMVQPWGKPTALQKPAPARLAEGTRSRSHTLPILDPTEVHRSFNIPRKPLSIASSDYGTHHRSMSQQSATTSISEGTHVDRTDFELREGPASFPDFNCVEPLPTARLASVHRNRPGTSSSTTSSRLHSPLTRSRSGTESSSRRSSLWRQKADVEEAVRELNTIVEEKRMEPFRITSQELVGAVLADSEDSSEHSKRDFAIEHALTRPHVPAIVPTMKVYARTETLSDIGSAFSIPLTERPFPGPPASKPSVEDLEKAMSRSQLEKPQLSVDPSLVWSNKAEVSPHSSPIAVSARAKISKWIHKSLGGCRTSNTDGDGPDYITQSYNNHVLQERTNPISPYYRWAAEPCSSASPQSPSSSTTTSLLDQSPSKYSSSLHSRGALTRASSFASLPRPSGDRGKPGTEISSSTHQEAKPMGPLSVRGNEASARMLAPPAYREVDPHPNQSMNPASENMIVGLAF